MATPTPLTYRLATPDDAPTLASFIKAAYRGESSRAGWTTEADLVADDRIDAAGLQAKIAEPNGAIILAYDEQSKLASCCELIKRDDGKLAYFGLFAVDPLRQSGGIGRQVLAEAERHAKEEFGVVKMEMCVIWPREELISWYVRRGYKKTEETRPFPYAHLVNGAALRDDLHFAVLIKDL